MGPRQNLETSPSRPLHRSPSGRPNSSASFLMDLPNAQHALTVALCSIALKVAFRFVILDICFPVVTDVHVGIVADIYGSKHVYTDTHMCCAQYVGQYISKCVQHDYVKHMTQTKLLVSQGSSVLTRISAHQIFPHHAVSVAASICA